MAVHRCLQGGGTPRAGEADPPGARAGGNPGSRRAWPGLAAAPGAGLGRTDPVWLDLAAIPGLGQGAAARMGPVDPAADAGGAPVGRRCRAEGVHARRAAPPRAPATGRRAGLAPPLLAAARLCGGRIEQGSRSGRWLVPGRRADATGDRVVARRVPTAAPAAAHAVAGGRPRWAGEAGLHGSSGTSRINRRARGGRREKPRVQYGFRGPTPWQSRESFPGPFFRRNSRTPERPNSRTLLLPPRSRRAPR